MPDLTAAIENMTDNEVRETIATLQRVAQAGASDQQVAALTRILIASHASANEAPDVPPS